MRVKNIVITSSLKSHKISSFIMKEESNNGLKELHDLLTQACKLGVNKNYFIKFLFSYLRVLYSISINENSVQLN